MSSTNPSRDKPLIEVQSIVLESIKYERGFEFKPGHDGQASLGMHLEQPAESQDFRSTRCKVELKDINDKSIVLVETTFRALFDIQGNRNSAGIEAYLSSVAMRITYPYHRQLIATLTAQGGLPGVTIPLIADDQLESISKESVEDAGADG